MNLAYHLQRAALVYGARPAVALGTRTVWSYAELAARVARAAAALRGRHGLRPGDAVALIMRNTPAYLELLYACWYAGLMAVPVNARLHREEFRWILQDSGARLCLVTPDLGATIAAAAPTGVEHIIEVDGPDYLALQRAEPMVPVPCAPADPAWLFYTSGTTGRPKGATLTHGNLMSMCLGYFADVDPGAPWNAILHAAPMSHGSGIYALPSVVQAACHVIPESGGFDADEVFRLLGHWSGLSFFAAPTMVKRLVDAPGEPDTRKLKRIIYGGGPMYVADCRAALARFGPKLSQLYGQGECPMTITALGPALIDDREHPRWLERLASVGVAQTPVQVRVVDAQMREVALGAPGEVVVKGEVVMAGYWGNAAASAEAIRDGWLHTGDIGSLDADGFLTLKDRSKDLIISGGTNIYPREVEEVLQRHPQVAEVSVIGRPDREWGESVVAFVVARAGGELGPAALDAFCQQHMARFKRPRYYHLVDALPKNNYGKVLKTTLRETDAAACAAGTGPSPV